MNAFASAPVDVGALVLAVVAAMVLAGILIDRRETGGTRGMHAAPAGHRPPVKIIPGQPPWAPETEPALAPLPAPVPVTARAVPMSAEQLRRTRVEEVLARAAETRATAAQLARGNELLAGWVVDVAAASGSPDWGRGHMPAWVAEELGHETTGDAVDSMYTRVQAALTAALTAPAGAAPAPAPDGAL